MSSPLWAVKSGVTYLSSQSFDETSMSFSFSLYIYSKYWFLHLVPVYDGHAEMDALSLTQENNIKLHKSKDVQKYTNSQNLLYHFNM